MDNGRELIEALTQVSQEKGIDKEVIFEAIETSLVSACKKHFGQNANIRVTVDRKTGEYTVLAAKTVSEEVTDPMLQISLDDAREINSSCELDDVVEVVVTPKNFGRISAQTAKQVVVQKFREAEREILYDEFSKKEHNIVSAVVQRRDKRNVYVSLGRLEAALLPNEQIPRESYQFQDRIKVYVLEVKQNSKGPIVNVSRTHPDLLTRLFEQEVPEVSDGIVEIKSVAREAGSRSKIAVYTKHQHVEPIGSCVGQNGQRVNAITRELKGEKIDIVLWSEDPVKYIANALSPSKVVTVVVNPLDTAARVIVPDAMLSLAIGKEGQNARLAARLTGWRIDIKSESQARGTDFLIFPELEAAKKAAEEKKISEMEAAYADFYGSDEESSNEQVPAATEEVTEYGDEYYDYDYDDYYDDEYYDDEYYDDEYYGDEYYDEYYEYDENAEPAADEERPAE